MWIDIPGERLAETRVRDAVEYGAEILAVACPFCLLTIEDAIKTTNLESQLQVMDVVEVVSLTL
jgi:Fe-S oxidoreductase